MQYLPKISFSFTTLITALFFLTTAAQVNLLQPLKEWTVYKKENCWTRPVC